MRILFITDSLGLPRKSPEMVEYESTWCWLLSKDNIIHQFSYGGGTVNELLSQVHYLKLFKPDRVVIQSGIVDCAPRALTKYENYLYNKYWVTRKLLSWGSPRILRWLRKRGKTYTGVKVFKDSVLSFKREFGEDLYWVGIIPPSRDYEKKIYGITKNVNLYNQVIKDELKGNFVDLSEMPRNCVMSDYHHMNKKGHKYLAETLINILK